MCKTLVTLTYPLRPLSYSERVQLPLLSVRKRLTSHHAFISSSLWQKKVAEQTRVRTKATPTPPPKTAILTLELECCMARAEHVASLYSILVLREQDF